MASRNQWLRLEALPGLYPWKAPQTLAQRWNTASFLSFSLDMNGLAEKLFNSSDPRFSGYLPPGASCCRCQALRL